MKKLLITSLLFVSLFFLQISEVYAVYVNGYYRSNGTYVNGYERTSPDGDPTNNYSYPGNYNPNTGSITGGSTQSYLNNYYNNSSSNILTSPSIGNYNPPVTTYRAPTTPTCPINSFYDGISSCTCSSGYVVSSGQCRPAILVCSDQIGVMSQYNSTTKKCECMSGYEFNGGVCSYKKVNYYSTPIIVTPTKSLTTCPVNSHTSLSNPDMCSCDSGYEINSSKNACIRTPIKTNTQLCQDSFGSNTDWDGTKAANGQPNCNCKANHVWDAEKTACILMTPAQNVEVKTNNSVKVSAIVKKVDAKKLGLIKTAQQEDVINTVSENVITSSVLIVAPEQKAETRWYMKILNWLKRKPTLS